MIGESGVLQRSRIMQTLRDFMTLEIILRTLELIDLCFRLKEAYIRQLQPQASPEKIRELIYQCILTRKKNNGHAKIF